jgi:AraC family transcriptional regulator, regulatory protein of adaptative response / DNA-3-methyladenine glycosylase II
LRSRAHGPFKVAVHAVVSQELRGPSVRSGLGRLIRSYGTPIAGLTHAFPSAEALTNVLADEYGHPTGSARPSALARAVVSGAAVTPDGSEPLEELVGSLVAVPGISAAAAHHIALHLGARDAFPAMDANVQRELLRRGTSLDVSSVPWRR